MRFLLLTSQLGDPERKPLTTAQLRDLAARVRGSVPTEQDTELALPHLLALGYSQEMGQRILKLLSEKELLAYYLQRGHRAGCVPLTRAGADYPAAVRRRLGEDSPGCVWAKGNLKLLNNACVSLVGSRDLRKANEKFAEEAGRQAAIQGYTLVSGNARGADRAAQEACLAAGGSVICVVADQLSKHSPKERVLYLSENAFDSPFSSQSALSRNRIIHSLGTITLVAQATLGKGGTWSGTVRNLKSCWSSVFCFDDGSDAAKQLGCLGAQMIGMQDILHLKNLADEKYGLFDRV